MATNVQRGRRSTGLASRRRQGPFIEQLEKRACPAAVAITGPAEIDETAGTAQIVVTLTERSRAPVTVSYSIQSTASTATYDRDFRLFSGRTPLRPPGILTFRAGQTAQVITMQVLDDTLREGNESFTFSLQQARGATLNPAARNLTVTIKDNDNYTVSIVGPRNVNAGATIEYSLRLSSPATRHETFYVSTREGTARVTQDYRKMWRVPVTILPGQSSASFRITTVSDPVPDYDRTLFIDVSPAIPGFPPPTPFQVTIRGVLGPVPPSISIADVTVLEGAVGTTTTANFVVTLSTPFPQSVSVDYTSADGTATAANNDYIARSGTLTFAPGEMSKTVSVTVVGDANAESNETFQLALSNSANAFLVRSTATGTITNDDDSPFNISIVYVTAMQPAWTQVVERAARRWEEVIVGDLPDVLFEGRVIDDFEIRVSLAPDNPNLLGYARFLEQRSGSGGLPFLGEMSMNSLYADEGGFFDTVVHELGHALGFTPYLWQQLGLYGGTLVDPRFLGTNATREFNAAFGRTDAGVPLYERGGPGDGSYGAHWRDSLFGYEMMVSAGPIDRSGASLSRITVGQFEDIGYEVNYAAADPFVANSRQAALNVQRLQPTSSPINRRMAILEDPRAASLFAAVAFMDQLIDGAAGSVATRAFRALGAIRG